MSANNELKRRMTLLKQEEKELGAQNPMAQTQECLDMNGNMTMEFENELKTMTMKTVQRLETNRLHAAKQDLFGILRRQCEACGDGCLGYRPLGVVCPSAKSELDFPSFCQNCGCPACFHQIVPVESSLPDQMCQSILSYNIRQCDLNFNSVAAIFEIKNFENGANNIGSLLNLLKGEGMEILSMETRPLDVQEAMFVKYRKVQLKEQEISEKLNKGYDMDHDHKLAINPSPAFQAISRNDLAKLDKITMDCEQSIRRKIMKLTKGKIQEMMDQENINTTNMIRSQTTFLRDDINDSEEEEKLTTSINPRPLNKGPKVTNSLSKKKTTRGEKKVVELKPYGVNEIIQTMERSPDLAKMLVNKYLIVVVGSTSSQNLEKKMKNQIIPSYFELVSEEEISITYSGNNKIESMEDTLLFAPQLFRLQKSVILTEPLQSLFSIQKQKEDPSKTLDIEQIRKSQTLAPPSDTLKQQSGQVRELTNFLRKKTIKMMSTQKVDSFNKSSTIIFDDEKPQKEIMDTKWTSRNEDKNRIYFNYGTMLDFFDYSGVVVQNSIRYADLVMPKYHGYAMLPQEQLQKKYRELAKGLKSAGSKPCNLYAIAKVGTPNMIFPNTLDVQIRNFQDRPRFLQITDYFFPEQAKSQYSVILLKPIVVKNGLNDMFVEVLKANEFRILKRKVRQLTQSEASYFCQLEKCSKENMQFFVDSIMDGPSEIVILSKIGAVEDAKAICNGTLSGRRRSNQTGDEENGSRANVDSMSAMFEIAPFSSFNELIDLEDFLLQHYRLKKYKEKTLSTSKQTATQLRNIDAIVVQKAEEIRFELNSFQRAFSFAALAAPTEQDALTLMSILTPRVTRLENIFLVLNPKFNHLIEKVEELLVRMQQKFCNRVALNMDYDQARHLLEDKFNPDDSEGKRVMKQFSGKEVHIFHLAKVAGIRELKSIFQSTEASLSDHISNSTFITDYDGSFLPSCIPYLFLFMDCDKMEERARELLYGVDQTIFTGRDFLNKLPKKDIQQILEMALFTNIGESILKPVFDRSGDLVPFKDTKELKVYKNALLSTILGSQTYDLGVSQTTDFQIQRMMSQTMQDDSSVRYIVEGTTHSLYELRFHKINHRGDMSLSSFQVDEMDVNQDQRDSPSNKTTKKSVRFQETLQTMGDLNQALKGMPIQKEIMYFFKRFASLNFYYSQVATMHGGGLCPMFYRYRICPLDGSKLNRVYEVEEHVGKLFLEEATSMHLEHIRLIESAKQHKKMSFTLSMAESDKQMSLPAFIMGRQLAQMCKKLEKVQCIDQDLLQGAGELIYSETNKELRGEVKYLKNYFDFDKRRYEGILEYLKEDNRWNKYVSTLETEIIQDNLEDIISSLTFKYSRQPELLSLIPDRMTEFNLRINKVLKIFNPEGKNATKQKQRKYFKQDQGEESSDDEIPNDVKFYRDVYSDPNRSADIHDLVGSLMYALDEDQNEIAMKKMKKKKVKFDKGDYTFNRDMVEGSYQEEDRDYAITKNVAISAVEVAKRPKYQLVASLLYLINFWLRKVNRRTDLLLKAGSKDKDIEKEYDMLLDAIVKGLTENYGDDEINHVLDIVSLRRGHESLFQLLLQKKLQIIKEKQAKLEARVEKAKRKKRNNPNTPIIQLIDQEVRETYTSAKVSSKQHAIVQKLQGFLAQKTENPSLTAKQNDQFQKLMNETTAKLGPNTKEIAEDLLLKTQMELDRKLHNKPSIQEKISFVKMEYFLYTLVEVHRLVKELEKLKYQIPQTQTLINQCQTDRRDMATQLGLASNDLSRGSNQFLNKGIAASKKQLERFDKQIQGYEQQIDEIRYQMAQRETEVLLVLRELIACDIYAPETHFNGDMLTKQGKYAKINDTGADYTVPRRTFWIPLDAMDENIDPKSAEAERFYYKHQSQKNPDILGKFQAPFLKELKEIEKRQRESQTKQKEKSPSPSRRGANSPSKKLPEGENMLREYKKWEFPEDLTFKKFVNPSYTREQEQIKKLTEMLHQRAAPEKQGPSAKEMANDPFIHLRNKERADGVIGETINLYLSKNSHLVGQAGLDVNECRELTKLAIERMQERKVTCESFDLQNFKTIYKIYQDPSSEIDKAQLKNFLKSVAEV